MSQNHSCPCSKECALQAALNKIGGKWKLPILCSLLNNGQSRYNELLRSTKGVSNTMLSKTLKELETDGLIERREYLEVPVRVEYRLSERAQHLQPILIELIKWELSASDSSSGRSGCGHESLETGSDPQADKV